MASNPNHRNEESNDSSSLEDLYSINVVPSELFFKFRKEIHGFRLGLNLEVPASLVSLFNPFLFEFYGLKLFSNFDSVVNFVHHLLVPNIWIFLFYFWIRLWAISWSSQDRGNRSERKGSRHSRFLILILFWIRFLPFLFVLYRSKHSNKLTGEKKNRLLVNFTNSSFKCLICKNW